MLRNVMRAGWAFVAAVLEAAAGDVALWYNACLSLWVQSPVQIIQ